MTRAGSQYLLFYRCFWYRIRLLQSRPQDTAFTATMTACGRPCPKTGMVFLYFGRFGCGFCDKTNKESFSDAAVKKAYSENYVLVYANSESMDRLVLPSGERITEMQLGERMNTLGTPVFFFLKPDGTEILKIYGFQDAQRLLEMDRYIQGGNYANVSFKDFLRSQ